MHVTIIWLSAPLCMDNISFFQQRHLLLACVISENGQIIPATDLTYTMIEDVSDSISVKLMTVHQLWMAVSKKGTESSR